MRIHIDIRHDIPTDLALRCVAKVIEQGRVSANGKMYAYATVFDTHSGEVWVAARPYRKSDCFLVYLNNKGGGQDEQTNGCNP